MSIDRWNYWIEISSNGSEWVDLNGNAIDRVIFCVLEPKYTVPNAAIYALDFEPSSISNTIESFPDSFLPIVPEFHFSICSVYSDLSNSFYTRDILLALEQVNLTYGKSFSIIGKPYRVIAGDARLSGMYYASSGYWFGAFGVLSGVTAPIPETSETMRVYNAGIITSVERTDQDAITIETGYPDQVSTTGKAISADDQDAIEVLIYSNGERLTKCAIVNGKIYLGRPAKDVKLYIRKGDGEPKEIDSSSYFYDKYLNAIWLRGDASLATYDFSHPDISAELFGPPYNHLTYTPEGLAFQNGPSRFMLSQFGEVVTFDKSGQLTAPNYNPLLISPNICKVNGVNIPTNNASGRGVDGYTKSTSEQSGNVYLYSSNGEIKYNVLVKATPQTNGAYPATYAIPDNLLKDKYSDTVIYTRSFNGNGDIYRFIQQSKEFDNVLTWDSATGKNAPITIYARPENKNIGAIRIKFSELSNLSGKIDGEIKLNLQLKYVCFRNKSSSTFREKYRSFNIYDSEFKLIATVLSDENSSPNVVRSEYNINLGDEPIKMHSIGDVKSLQDIYLVANFPYAPQESEGNLTLYGYGVLSLWAAQIEVNYKQELIDNDTIYVSYNSKDDDVNKNAKAYDVIKDLYSRFCPVEKIVGDNSTGYEVSLSLSKSEPLRDTIRDVLSSSLCGFRPNYFTVNKDITFNLFSVQNAIDASPILIDQDDIFLGASFVDAEVQTSPLSSVYSSILVKFDYDEGSSKFKKNIFVDSNGYQFTGFNPVVFGNSDKKCEYAFSLLNGINRTKVIELRFATEQGALTYLDTIANFICYPVKRASVDIPITNSSNILHLTKVNFSGNKLPYFLTICNWLVLDYSHDVSIDGGNTKIETLIEVPDWSFLNG